MVSNYVDKLKARKRKQFMAVALIGLLLLLSFIAYALFGESGILVNMRVNQEHANLVREQQQLIEENRRLRSEIEAIRTKPRKVEAVVREAYGFGRPGEVVFLFPEDDAQDVQRVDVPASR